MKKATFANLITIVSILILCVMALIAIYATAPDSSVLLLDENFNILDESKWKHEISEYKKDGKQYHYVMGNEENRLIADGVLLIQSNFTDIQLRNKSERLSHCIAYADSENSTADCFTAKLQYRNVFNASCGRIEVRAKLRSQNLIRFYIKITPDRNNLETEKGCKDFLKSANETSTNNSAEFEISFETASNKAIIKSAIVDDEFHIYEIHWDSKKISLNIDKEKVDEKELKPSDLKKENTANKPVKFNTTPIGEPFYLNVGVNIREQKEINLGSSADKKRYLENSVNYYPNSPEELSFFEMDYIRLFRILN